MKEEISLYFHIPFCTKKCSYCHFYVLPDKDPLKKQLLEALKWEWDRIAPMLKEKEIVTIYFGGGTPSLFGAEAIAEILSWIKDKPSEITLEANPETITEQMMKAYAAAGINRISIGIQSLDQQLLKKLGRLHSGKKAMQSVYETFSAGIKNISIDLMYDLPHQTLQMWENTLSQALALPITHLSLYNLTIEPHTLFFKQKTTLEKLIPDAETSLRMYEMATEMISEKLPQYEISAFSKKGFHSHHNVGYWIGRSFLGLGPSAFSYYQYQRFQNIANLSKYHKLLSSGQSPVDYKEELTPDARRKELLAIGLRLMEGVNLKAFESEHGLLESDVHTTLQNLVHEGFLTHHADSLRLTQRGILFYDSVAVDII